MSGDYCSAKTFVTLVSTSGLVVGVLTLKEHFDSATVGPRGHDHVNQTSSDSNLVFNLDDHSITFLWVGHDNGTLMTLDGATGDLTVKGEIHAAGYGTPVEYKTAWEFVPVLSLLAAALVWQHVKAARLLRELRALKSQTLRSAP